MSDKQIEFSDEVGVFLLKIDEHKCIDACGFGECPIAYELDERAPGIIKRQHRIILKMRGALALQAEGCSDDKCGHNHICDNCKFVIETRSFDGKEVRGDE